MTRRPTVVDPPSRLASLDVFRGLVMLVLIPDTYGGFSFYAMAARDPDNPIWGFLARLFTHAQWSGCTIWDLVMPAFLFTIGVAIPYSYSARKDRGDSDAWIFTHAVLRALALLILGVELQLSIHTVGDIVWPFVILALGLPLPALVAGLFRQSGSRGGHAFELAWWGAVLAASALRLDRHVGDLRVIALHDILPQVGLGYVFVFALSRYSVRTRALASVGILFAYWLAFLLFPSPGSGFDPRAAGLAPGDQVFTGYFAHWNKNTNLAASFDRWLLNLFPTAKTYVSNEHGYQTLNFIPSIVTMLFGTVAGDHLRRALPRERIRNGLLGAGGLAVFGGVILGWIACPIVKSIWTPSWTVFSAGVVTLALGGLYHAVDVRGARARSDRASRAWTLPFVVAGRNPILLYMLALHYRWWIVEVWRRGFGRALFAGYWGPLLESVACGLSLWLVACAAYRLRIFIRI